MASLTFTLAPTHPHSRSLALTAADSCLNSRVLAHYHTHDLRPSLILTLAIVKMRAKACGSHPNNRHTTHYRTEERNTTTPNARFLLLLLLLPPPPIFILSKPSVTQVLVRLALSFTRACACRRMASGTLAPNDRA